MKKLLLLISILTALLLTSCKKEPELEPLNDISFEIENKEGNVIPIYSLEIINGKTNSSIDHFIYNMPLKNNYPLIFEKNTERNEIILTFKNLYPINTLLMELEELKNTEAATEVTVFYSLNGYDYTRFKKFNLELGLNNLDFENILVKSLHFRFSKTIKKQIISKLEFTLGTGYTVIEDVEFSNKFLRYSGWTGADGIFSFNLGDPNELLFIFSDTFVGEVNENNKLRNKSTIVNNTIGYYDKSTNEFDFVYETNEDVPVSMFLPNSYLSNRPRNLFDTDGLSISNNKEAILDNENTGTMWLTEEKEAELIIDLKSKYGLGKMYLWNYRDNFNYGVKQFEVSFSDDLENYFNSQVYFLDKANELGKYDLEIDLHEKARYLKIKVLDSYDDSFSGLGKLMLFDNNGLSLFGEITGSFYDKLNANEETARLWLQDGVVVGDYFYVFPILVKDTPDLFKVHTVTMLKIPIVNNRLNYKETIYLNTPLQNYSDDGGVTYYGAGILDNTKNDNYIYIYGYKDLGGRNLVVSRTTKENIENFNEYEYLTNDGYCKEMTDLKYLQTAVSAELSVSYLNEQYILTVMENTVSGKISIATSNKPDEPFSEYQKLFETNESHYLRGAFSYNAKMHPLLNEPGVFVISYNVNTNNLGALSDARIYYPRFIIIKEIERK